jgi:nitrile hydratase
MDTIHDLGGREGFGPVRWQDDDDAVPFHHEWQARTWAMCMYMFRQFSQEQRGWTLDWSRHVLERIPPAHYLRMNYFEKWAHHLIAILIDDGVASVEEFVEGRPHLKLSPVPPNPLTVGADPAAPRYRVGYRVVTRRTTAAMHSRLPAYTRGHIGTVDVWHGPENFADASARGELRKEHLYTVRFDAAELWPETGGRPFNVCADLWESYLEPA